MNIKIKHIVTGAVLFECDADSVKSALQAGIKSGSDLRYSDLRYSDLRGSKNYSENHDIFQEIIRSRKEATFTSREWECIAYICIHRICWDSIQKRFSAAAGRVFRKLADAGYGEFLERYKKTKETTK